MIKLSDLIFEEKTLNFNINDIFLTGLSCDSRNMKKGYLFAALSKENDLHIQMAIKNGAVALLINLKEFKKYNILKKIGIIAVNDPKEFYGVLCSKFYNLKFKNIVAVTGTNGKTSVAWIVNNLWKRFGIKSASIGTLGVYDGKRIQKTGLTTPSIDNMYKELSSLDKKGYKNIIVEASSHGIHQNRIGGLNISIAVITSLSRDHLDYHKNFTNYKRAKLRLFETISSNGIAIINNSIKEYKEFIKVSKKNNLKVITVGTDKKSDWFYKIKPFKEKQELEIIYKEKKRKICTTLIGDHQINNLVTSMAVLIESGLSYDNIVQSVENIKSPPGRLEFIANTNDAKIYIDYAHTPDALKNILLSIRPYVKNRLCIVFGCGGDRDKGKRPIWEVLLKNILILFILRMIIQEMKILKKLERK